MNLYNRPCRGNRQKMQAKNSRSHALINNLNMQKDTTSVTTENYIKTQQTFKPTNRDWEKCTIKSDANERGQYFT